MVSVRGGIRTVVMNFRGWKEAESRPALDADE